MLSTNGKPEKVLWDGDTKEERDADDEEVAHRVHVSELHKGEPHGTYKDQIRQNKGLIVLKSSETENQY